MRPATDSRQRSGGTRSAMRTTRFGAWASRGADGGTPGLERGRADVRRTRRWRRGVALVGMSQKPCRDVVKERLRPEDVRLRARVPVDAIAVDPVGDAAREPVVHR